MKSKTSALTSLVFSFLLAIWSFKIFLAKADKEMLMLEFAAIALAYVCINYLQRMRVYRRLRFFERFFQKSRNSQAN